MSKKQKPDNGLDDTPQLKPIGKSFGKGKGWQKYFQSNAVKAGVAGAVVLLLVLIVGWQLMSGGSGGKKPNGPTASSNSNQAQPAPSPPQIPAEPAPVTPDQKDTSADQNAQTGQENKQGQSPETQAEAQPGQPQPGMGATWDSSPGAENSSTPPKSPDDISKWEKGDFIRARQENNPKLLEAVAYLGEKFARQRTGRAGIGRDVKDAQADGPECRDIPPKSRTGLDRGNYRRFG